MTRRSKSQPGLRAPTTPRQRRKRKPPKATRGRVAWHWFQRLRKMPAFALGILLVMLLAVLLPTVNWIYQVVHKPTELFFPVSDALFKRPAATWAAYGPIFLAHATAVTTPELLAALAQTEASGNPIARTYWRWSFSREPFKIFRPASSAVGMYQITDGTFDEARRYCIHDHRVVAQGRWNDWHACWFNGLYMRVIPSHAVELTSANLTRQVAEILQRHHLAGASVRQQQDLAILTHLCGAGAASRYAARGLRLRPGQRCGDHDASAYLAKVHAMERIFARLRRAG